MDFGADSRYGMADYVSIYLETATYFLPEQHIRVPNQNTITIKERKYRYSLEAIEGQPGPPRCSTEWPNIPKQRA